MSKRQCTKILDLGKTREIRVATHRQDWRGECIATTTLSLSDTKRAVSRWQEHVPAGAPVNFEGTPKREARVAAIRAALRVAEEAAGNT